MWINFPESDFLKANPPCNRSQMRTEFMDKLQNARTISGTPYVILSAYRSLQHEYSKGRSGTSSHTKGCAVDIRFLNGGELGLILKGLYLAGFTRIGINWKNKFVHVDDDKEQEQDWLWTY